MHPTTNKTGNPLKDPARLIEEIDKGAGVVVGIRWMVCPNHACREILVKIFRSNVIAHRLNESESWIAVPKANEPPRLDESIPEQYERDYREASMILEDSSRMSAVLSRKIIADLLKDYGRFDEHRLTKQIERFIADPSHAQRLKDDLQYGREIGNFGAHRMLDEEGNVVEATKDDAQWALEMVKELFDYFIVTPSRSEKRRREFDKKLEKAGRKRVREANDESKTEDTERHGDPRSN